MNRQTGLKGQLESLGVKAQELCYQIQKCAASKEQTDSELMASDLCGELSAMAEAAPSSLSNPSTTIHIGR